MYPEELAVIRSPSDKIATSTTEAELEIRIDCKQHVSFMKATIGIGNQSIRWFIIVLTFRAEPASHTLCYTLPLQYPNSCKPHVFLSCGAEVPNESRTKLRASLSKIVDSQVEGIECLDTIASEFRRFLADETDAVSSEAPSSILGGTNAGSDAISRNLDGHGLRIILWMHHLLATTKRRAIVQYSKELGLAGFSKPGYPGAVYVEGPADQVKVFVRELKVRIAAKYRANPGAKDSRACAGRLSKSAENSRYPLLPCTF